MTIDRPSSDRQRSSVPKDRNCFRIHYGDHKLALEEYVHCDGITYHQCSRYRDVQEVFYDRGSPRISEAPHLRSSIHLTGKLSPAKSNSIAATNPMGRVYETFCFFEIKISGQGTPFFTKKNIAETCYLYRRTGGNAYQCESTGLVSTGNASLRCMNRQSDTSYEYMQPVACCERKFPVDYGCRTKLRGKPGTWLSPSLTSHSNDENLTKTSMSSPAATFLRPARKRRVMAPFGEGCAERE